MATNNDLSGSAVNNINTDENTTVNRASGSTSSVTVVTCNYINNNGDGVEATFKISRSGTNVNAIWPSGGVQPTVLVTT